MSVTNASRSRRARLHGRPFGRAVFFGSTLVIILFLTLPLIAIILQVLPLGLKGWLDPATLDALTLSLVTATLSAFLAIGVGTPIA
jgi:ABC-type sulfate transport system permease component